MTKQELDKIICIVGTHDNEEGQWCDTGEDMEWSCRSECVSLAIGRLKVAFMKGEL